ncbi:MAG: helix-turn-helix domain-containing protein, partial [Pyrinomonadaceae bacterium]
AYLWPGNVRELENVVEYALVIGSGAELTVHDLPPTLLIHHPHAAPEVRTWLPDNASLAEVERSYIMHVYERSGKCQSKAAATLGVARRTLYRKLLQYGVIGDAAQKDQTGHQEAKQE